VVSLSVTHMESYDTVVKDLAAIAAVVQLTGGKMILGGGGSSRVRSEADADGVVLGSASELLDYIGSFARASHAGSEHAQTP